MSIASDGTIPLALRRIGTPDRFMPLFKEGIGLVEEVSVWFAEEANGLQDGMDAQGRLEFIVERSRLTTVLLEMSSWLFAHRALVEGETDFASLSASPSRPSLIDVTSLNPDLSAQFPGKMIEFVRRADGLCRRLRLIDASLYPASTPSNDDEPASDDEDGFVPSVPGM